MSKQSILGATNVGILIAVVAVIAIVIFIFAANTSDAPATTAEAPSERVESGSFEVEELPAVVEVDSEAVTPVVTGDASEQTPQVVESETEEPEVVIAVDPEPVVEEVAPAVLANGTYTDYDPALLANAEDGSVVLFFHAAWCPSCRALDKSINENFSDLPADVTILQLDFDTETELKKKYGVVRQHTLVQVDANGNEIKKITGLTNTLDQVLAKL